MVPTRHQLLITEPIPGVGPEFPIARVIDANVYVRHERGGLMLGGYETDPWQPDVAALSPGFAPRPASSGLDETELRERCRHAYATHYRSSGDALPTA